MFFVAAAENSNATHISIPSISFDNGLVEISALTTLVSSTAAASLVLGSRGPSGLSWAVTSAFGMIAVVQACLSAAIPGWLRETIGIRSSTSDLAIGFRLDLGNDSHSAKKVRKTLGRPIAIQCREDARNDKGSFGNILGNDIYAYDYATSFMINGIPEAEPGKPTHIFTYSHYISLRNHNKWIQVGVICLSFLKLIEAYIFWRFNDNMLAIVTSIPWCYFLLCAIVGEVIELRQAALSETTRGTIDILAGNLPTVIQPGGSRKIIIGAAQNPKHTILWTIMWSLGVIVCISSMLMTYILLGEQSKEVILVWFGFQALWMVIRLVLYYLIQPDDPATHQFEEQSLPSLSNDMKMRVLRLAMALSKYQTYLHPRGDYSYQYDCFMVSDIPKLLAQHAFAYPTSDNFDVILSSIQISIKAVIGDTTLSSATWISGSKLSPMELYDCCVVVFETRMNESSSSNTDLSSPSSLLAIPAVRVLAGSLIGFLPAELENAETPLFAPKGVPNTGSMISWQYWIPLDSGRWLFLSTPKNSLDICGQRVGSVMSDAEVTQQLEAGKYNIGFTHVEDVKTALEMSRHGFTCLQKIFQ